MKKKIHESGTQFASAYNLENINMTKDIAARIIMRALMANLIAKK